MHASYTDEKYKGRKLTIKDIELVNTSTNKLYTAELEIEIGYTNTDDMGRASKAVILDGKVIPAILNGLNIDRLPNGAEVISRVRDNSFKQEGVALCVWKRKDGYPVEFAVWSIDADGSASEGAYTDDIINAGMLFSARCKRYSFEYKGNTKVNNATKVRFRIEKHTDPILGSALTNVLALFPDFPATKDCCTCYAHVGQHSAADYKATMKATRAAKPEEYAALKKELESSPYNYVLEVL